MKTTPTLDRVLELTPRIRQRSEEIEANRRLPLDLVDDLVDAGCFRMIVPARYGGDELTLRQALEVIEQLAYADGATGWTTMIGAGSPILFGRLPAATFASIYANGPDVIGAGSLAPKGRAVPVANGYCVSGQWSFASGCQHANWLLGHSMVFGADGQPVLLENGMPAMKVAVFPSSQVEIVDTWHVAGLCGTGSQDFCLNDTFIPEERTFSIAGGASPVEGRIFRIPPLAQLPLLISSVAVGIGRAAIDDIAELAGGGKKRLFASKRLAESALFQDQLGEADAMLRGARALLHSDAEHAWALTVDGAEFSQLDRVRLRASAAQVVQIVTRVVDTAYTAGGGTALYAWSPLQRRLRDIHTLTQHIGVSREAFGFVGALLAGEEIDPLRPI